MVRPGVWTAREVRKHEKSQRAVELPTVHKELWKFKFQSMAGQSEEIIQVSLPDSLLQVASAHVIHLQRRPMMPKIPPLLRRENGDEHYDPIVVSIGPYHHGKPQYRLAEKFKLKALEMFVQGSGKDVQFFYTKVLELVTFCRGCYFHDSTSKYDDRTFAKMMLLDSCFIINYIFCKLDYKKYRQTTYDYLGQWYFGNVRRDLRLLENQIPFQLLKVLIRSRSCGESELKMLYSFLLGGKGKTMKKYEWQEKADRDDDRPFHILDCRWLGDTSELPREKNRSCFPRYELECLKRIRNAIIKYAIRRKTDPVVQGLLTKLAYSFRSATDLKAKGIFCKPSPFWSTTSINFRSDHFFATLEIPVRIISDETKSLLMNLIAYELFPIDPKMGRPVTAYVDFMKSLIDNPSDVKELRERKILFTNLCTDEDVVKLFNEIKTYHRGQKLKLHEKVKKAIEAHYNSKAKTWLAELLHTYFKSPWSAIALLAAAILLILTLIQTYFTVKPSSN